MIGVNTRNMYSCLQKYNKLNTVASCWTVTKLKCECVDRTERKQTVQSVAVVHAVTTVGYVTNHQLLKEYSSSGAYWFQYIN